MFCERLQAILKQKEITAYKVAKETEISQGLMNQYKNGKTIPSQENVSKIAKYLGVSTDYLLGITDDPEKADHSTFPLSDDEITLIRQYRLLSDEQKKYIIKTLSMISLS